MSQSTSTPTSSGPKPRPAAPVPQRSPEEIQAEIDAAQQRLATSVDELHERLSPASLADEVKGQVRSVFVDQYGSVKAKPVAIVAGTVAGLVVLRAIFHRD